MKLPILLVVCGLFTSHQAFGQGRASSEKRGGRTMLLSLPIVNFAGEATLHGESNIKNEGGLAAEIINKAEQEEATPLEADKGTSRITRARAFSLVYSRYANPQTMDGFYWGLGAGYRTENVDWLKPASALDASAAEASPSTHTSHIAELKGPTAHGRLGYRYVGKDVPLLIGAYLGLRHFAATVKDVEGTSKVRTGKSLPNESEVPAPMKSVEMTDAERQKLQGLYATRAEGGIEVGFAF